MNALEVLSVHWTVSLKLIDKVLPFAPADTYQSENYEMKHLDPNHINMPLLFNEL